MTENQKSLEAIKLDQNSAVKKTHKSLYQFGQWQRLAFSVLSSIVLSSWMLTYFVTSELFKWVGGLAILILIWALVAFWIALYVWLDAKRQRRLLNCPECGKSLLVKSMSNDAPNAIFMPFGQVSLKQECFDCRLRIWRPND